MLLLNLSSVEAHEKTGAVKILAAATEKRLSSRPDLPTIAESGVPGFETSVWFALWGPPNMPPELVSKIYGDVSRALDLPQSREFFKTNSFERVELSPVQFGSLVESDLKHWSRLINAVGAKIE
jgi:tripartite-type tricarboxylate transporter receptor subunit TctC